MRLSGPRVWAAPAALDHLEENSAAAGIVLLDEDLAALNDLVGIGVAERYPTADCLIGRTLVGACSSYVVRYQSA